MNICALCNKRPADKKNTHFLTDSIIRTALDSEGKNRRDSGLYYQIEPGKPFIKTKFQRSTSPEKIEEKLGRPPTESEIEEAMENDFSADNVFCTKCEKRFGEIEDEFIDKIIPSLQKQAQDGKPFSLFKESRTIRLFFYIQIWRSFVCTNALFLTKNTAENLRQMILDDKDFSEEKIKSYPLSVTFFITIDSVEDKTSNLVGYVNREKPILIFTDEFAFQFFENKNNIQFFNFHNLNSRQDYHSWLNTDEEEFKIRIFSNEQREKLNKSIIEAHTVQIIDYIKYQFCSLWYAFYKRSPTEQEFHDYYLYLTKDPDINWLSKEVIHQTLKDYFLNFS